MNTLRLFGIFFLVVLFTIFSRFLDLGQGEVLQARHMDLASFVPDGSEVVLSQENKIYFQNEMSISENYDWYRMFGKQFELLSANGDSSDDRAVLNFVLPDSTSFSVKIYQNKTTSKIDGVVTRQTP